MPVRISCPDFLDAAVLYAAGELSAEDRAAVDAHAHACSACLAILRSEMELREAIAARGEFSGDSSNRGVAREKPNHAALLGQCRSELAEALDELAPPATPLPESGWSAWLSPQQWLKQWTRAFRHALAFHPGWSTAALVILGAVSGFVARPVGRAWYRATMLPLAGNPEMTVSAVPRLTDQELATMGIEGIRWEPQDGATSPHVEVRLRSERPVIMQGSADDTEIRRVLTYVVAHGQKFDPGVRLDAVDVLRAHLSDPQVRSALCEAAIRDADPAVRLKALEALRGLETDSTVREAMLGALAEDANSGVRIEAVNALLAALDGSDAAAAISSGTAPAGIFDPQAIDILRDRQQNDPNSYVRLRSAAVLGRLASMQTSGTGATSATSESEESPQTNNGSVRP